MSKVWSIVSLFLLYYALNSYLVTQGGETIFGATLIVKSRVPAGFLAIPICSFLLLFASLIGIVFARRNGPRWADRIPLVGFEQLDMTKVEAKVYQAAMLVLLSLIPALTLIHFWRVAARAQLVTTDPQPVRIPGGIWDWRALTSLDNPANICSEVTQKASSIVCEGRATILPGLEPTIFAVLTAASVCAMIAFWWFVMKGMNLPRTDSHLLSEATKGS
ncbi:MULTISPECIES: hypothetical protein [unclassified Bradyrhizobium]